MPGHPQQLAEGSPRVTTATTEGGGRTSRSVPGPANRWREVCQYSAGKDWLLKLLHFMRCGRGGEARDEGLDECVVCGSG